MILEIGTPIYQSPELIQEGRYDQKVDIYSLGIIFFELFSGAFSTSMERITRILELKGNLQTVAGRFSESVSKQELLKNLLSRSPEDRPSASDILAGPFLPPLLEDHYVQEALRAISKSDSVYFPRLLGTLFRRTSAISLDYTFDYNSGTEFNFGYLQSLERVKGVLTCVFRRHCGIEVYVPRIIPQVFWIIRM